VACKGFHVDLDAPEGDIHFSALAKNDAVTFTLALFFPTRQLHVMLVGDFYAPTISIYTRDNCKYTLVTYKNERMSIKKYSLVRSQIKAILRRAGMPNAAIERYLNATAAELCNAARAAAANVAVPDEPLERWPEEAFQGETPVVFIQRVYGHLIRHGRMNQADLGRIDENLLKVARNFCSKPNVSPKRPRLSDIIPPSTSNPDSIAAKFGEPTYADVLAYKADPTPENYARKKAYFAMKARESRERKLDLG
jgi:hypothetical protein